MRLFHFSSEQGIAEFVPRPPLRHPKAEPLVYAIDEEHSPLYLFPRDCPRIGIWALPGSLPEHEAWLNDRCGGARMLLIIDLGWEARLKSGRLVRYEFTPGPPFEDCHDHGVWASREAVLPVAEEVLMDLLGLAQAAGAKVEVSPCLASFGRAVLAGDVPCGSLHVSMVRMSSLPAWQGPAGTPVSPL